MSFLKEKWVVYSLFVISLFLSAALLGACEPIGEPGASSLPAVLIDGTTPSDVYQRLSPGVAFIETPTGTGSGLIVEANEHKYVVTNAHVVWPYSEARVVFPNREEHLSAPLLQTDALVDLAVLGPIDTEIPALNIDSTYTPITGETVYLIGYPGEDELFPDPALAVGIISRTRIWESLDGLRYYQTDAASAGGQSGGILASQFGDVIGFTGMLFADSFVLAVSSADLAPRVEALIASAVDPANSGAVVRGVMPENSTTRRSSGQLETLWDTHGYVLTAPEESEVEVEVTSKADFGVALYDTNGEEVAASDNVYEGTEVVSGTITTSGPYFVLVEQYDAQQSEYSISSNRPIARIADPDDGIAVTVGETVIGAIDYPGDTDWFNLVLDGRSDIVLRVEATAIDPVVSIGRQGAEAEYYREDDDSGRGMFGSNAMLEFRTRRSGDYLVVVRSFSAEELGGYLLTIEDIE